MKKVFNYLMIAAVAAMACTACDDDDDGVAGVDKSKNYISYAGEEYEIEYAYLLEYGDYYENGTYSYGIQFQLPMQKFKFESDFVEINFLLNTSTFPKEIKTFGYSDSHAAETMDAVFYGIGEDASDDGKLKSGSATISKTGDNVHVYDISFTVTTPGGKTISGHHKDWLYLSPAPHSPKETKKYGYSDSHAAGADLSGLSGSKRTNDNDNNPI
ncbi:MAG: hypothetical protein LBL04_04530 [Bacteroidales bacterium]|jgi:hypothetical protein|nr:hypothetical protein [Bacteroidales bacterium]